MIHGFRSSAAADSLHPRLQSGVPPGRATGGGTPARQVASISKRPARRLVALIIALAIFSATTPAGSQVFNEAVSRAVTVANRTDPVFNETISRAVTVINRTSPTLTEAISRPVTVVIPMEVISRALTLLNRTTPAPTEAISRAATVVNRTSPVFDEAVSRASTIVNRTNPVFDEAISRAATVCNVAGLGDLDQNGQLDLADIGIFVGVLLGIETDLALIEASDLNCDTLADGSDIQPFIDEMLTL